MTTHGLHWKVQEQFTESANEFLIDPLAIFMGNLDSRHVQQFQRTVFLLKKINYFYYARNCHFHTGTEFTHNLISNKSLISSHINPKISAI